MKTLRITTTKEMQQFCKEILKKSGAVYLNYEGINFEDYKTKAVTLFKIQNDEKLFISDYDRSFINLIANNKVDTNITLSYILDKNGLMEEHNLYMHKVTYFLFSGKKHSQGLLYCNVGYRDSNVY